MFATTLALLLVAQPQVASTAEQSNIIVTAPRQADAATVQHYVRAISTTTGGQLAAFRSPVCPAVFGMPEQYTVRLVNRIRAVAGRAGMEVAPDGCTPNMTLIFANNSLSAVREMQRLRPGLFNGMATDEVQRLTRGSDPVRAWSLTEVRNEDGSDFAPGADDEASRAGGSGGPNMAGSMRVSSSSILTLPTQRVITQSIMVMDEAATVGKTLNQIADYAAVRGLGGTRSGASGGAGNSILGLFDAGATAPRGLTSLDLAYLQALHATRGNQRSTSHLSRIAERISGQLAARSPR